MVKLDWLEFVETLHFYGRVSLSMAAYQSISFDCPVATKYILFFYVSQGIPPVIETQNFISFRGTGKT